jgi:glycosyltransferase involved in cell wall biosynthesis
MSSLTLCMIVKDEAAFLAGCLESVKGVVDSIVVVDTGSTDATVAIAESHGAEVVHHVWSEDFAAARNAGLERVSRTKDRFVLVLDADERLGPGAQKALRAALKRADFDLGFLALHDATALDAEPADVIAGRSRRGEPVLLPRLLRFEADLRYEGRVHEQVTDWAARPGRRFATIDAPIVHYGAVPGLRAAKGKGDRNRRLLELRAQEEPGNPNVRAYLAREYERCGESSRALEEARAAWAALVASAKHTVSAPQGKSKRKPAPATDAVLPTTMMAYLSIQHGDLDAAADALSTARTWIDCHPNVELLSGLVHERRALAATDVETFARELAAARADYERCLGLRGREFAAEIMPGACGATGTLRLATVLLLAGDTDAAGARFESILRADPAHVEARLGRCEAWIDGGSAARALPELEELVATGTPDAWILSAAATDALDDPDTARVLAQRAFEVGRENAWICGWRRARFGELLGRAGAVEQPVDAIVVTERPTVSVVVPCFNRFDLLRPVLQGFMGERATSAFQLVLVDDGSEPPLEGLVNALGIAHSVDLVRRANGGRGAALNTGLARATGEIVVFCDSDITPTPGFVEEHVDFHRENRSELATHLGALEWGVDAGLFGALTGARANPRLRGGTRQVDWTQWFTDNWSFKRSLFASRGLEFDTAYRAWGFEELDLARQLQQLGATNTLTTRAKGLHGKPATPAGMRACFARSVPNLLYLARKDPADAHVRGWLAAHADEESVARAERAYECTWARLCEIDAEHADALRHVNVGLVDKLAITLSDATFHIGIARGLVQHATLADLHANLLPRASSVKLFGVVEQFAQRLDIVERRLDLCGHGSTWIDDVARELALNPLHALRGPLPSTARPAAPAPLTPA